MTLAGTSMRTGFAGFRCRDRHVRLVLINDGIKYDGCHQHHKSYRAWSLVPGYRNIHISSSEIRSRSEKLRPRYPDQYHIQTITTTASPIGTGTPKTKEEKQEQRRLNYLRSYVFKYCASVQLFLDYPDLLEGDLTAKRNVLIAAAQHQDRIQPDNQHVDTSRATSKYAISQMGGIFFVPGCQNDRINTVLSGLTKSLSLENIKTPLEVEAVRGQQTALDQEIFNKRSIRKVEELLEYEFRNKTLLMQALTRTSVEAGKSTYQRLEFLGDAIIDYIIAVRLFCNVPNPVDNTISLTTIHGALANYSLLAYLSMRLSNTSSAIDYEHHHTIWQTAASSIIPSTTQRLIDHIVISPDLPQAQQRMRAEKTYTDNAKKIDAAFSNLVSNTFNSGDASKAYPWTLLQSIDTSKVYSDIIESIIAAVFIDSRGDLTQCTNLLFDTIGLIEPLMKIETSPNDFDTRPPLFKLCMLRPDLEVKRSHSGSLSKGNKRWITRLNIGCEKSQDGHEELAYGVSDISAAHADCLAAEGGLNIVSAMPEKKAGGEE